MMLDAPAVESAPLVLSEIRDRVGWLTINHSRKRNALSAAVLGELIAGLEEFGRERLPVVVIRARPGAKVWSSGLDINELPKGRRDPFGYDDSLERTLRAIQRHPGVVIAMIQGAVWGGACDLALTCDLLVGDPTCSFAITPVKLGLPYNASGILHFISRVGINRAKEMFFRAQPVDARRAEMWGLLNHLVPGAKLEGFVTELASRICENSSLAIAAIKEQFRILDSAHPISPETFERIQGIRRRVYDSHDYAEGIQAFLEKRPPRFRGE